MIEFNDLPIEIILRVFEFVSPNIVYEKFIYNHSWLSLNSIQSLALQYIFSKRVIIASKQPRLIGYDPAKILYSVRQLEDSFIITGFENGIDIFRQLMALNFQMNTSLIPRELGILFSYLYKNEGESLVKFLEILAFDKYCNELSRKITLQLMYNGDQFISKNARIIQLVEVLGDKVERIFIQSNQTQTVQRQNWRLWDIASSDMLTDLYLRRNGLTDVDARHLFRLLPLTLKKLDLTANDLTSLVDLVLPPTLETLMIRANKLHSLQGPNYAFGSSLHTLDASINSISELENLFQFSSTIASLKVTYNAISTVQQSHIPPNVEILALSNNVIQELNVILPQTIQQLYIDNNSLKSLPIDFFSNCTKLEILDISNNNIDDLDELGDLPLSLRELMLDNNEIDYFEITNAFTTNLTKLSMSSTGLVALIDINMPSKLKQLNLSRNEISEIKNVNFGSKLIDLDLSRNKLTTFSGDSFPYTLTKLDISDNPFKSIDAISLPETLTYLCLNGVALGTINNDLINKLPRSLHHLELNSTCWSNSQPFQNPTDLETSLQVNFDQYLPNLKILFLERNNIISVDDVTYPLHLQTLSYEGNKLAQFPFNTLPSAVYDLRLKKK
ncbi:hypothetical protein DFJ63DRAFT_313462 [Scheffersomyces coipomensis]|uniref:uncharacterized protein n=1 Tax=Scheffersomyces coipomensis TaxID=1788519 RepID=UPI00315C86CC